MLTYHRTSLLESQAQTLVNTVNTVGVMGKGLAAEFRKTHPGMYDEYKRICAEGLLDIGKLWLWKSEGQWVLNFPTKKHWRYPSKLEYVERGLQKFAAEYEVRGIREIAFPRLGCGNGGLNWRDVQPLMHRYLEKLPIRIYVHDFAKKVRQPEHITYISSGNSFTFHDFMCDIRSAIGLNFGEFATITNHSPFSVAYLDDNSLKIKGNKASFTVSELDLYDLWLVLQKGPVAAGKMVGTAREARYYLIALLSALSYMRVIKIAADEGDEGALAVEFDRSYSPTGLIAA